MGIDFEPLFHIVFFALGFVPVIVLGAIASAFIVFPLWWVAIGAIAAGLMVDAWFFLIANK